MNFQAFVNCLSFEEKQELRKCLVIHDGVGALPPLTREEKEVANGKNQKINAIKLYRNRTFCGLKEAKDKVEEYMNRTPMQEMQELIRETEQIEKEEEAKKVAEEAKKWMFDPYTS